MFARADDSGKVQAASAQELSWTRAVCLAELAWLGNPTTFHEHLSALLAGDCLEIHGTISNEANRNLAMKLAREASHLTVVDHMTMASVPAQPAPKRSSHMVYQDAVQALYHDCPQLSRALTVSAQDRGEILVRGEVPTLEDKLTISRSLRAVAGCNCVKNQVRAKAGMTISVNAPGTKPPVQDNSLLARLGLVQPRTEVAAAQPAIVRHQPVREPAGNLILPTPALAQSAPERVTLTPSIARTEVAVAPAAPPKPSHEQPRAAQAAAGMPATVAQKSVGSGSAAPHPVAGSILLTSATLPSETDKLRRAVATTCGIEEKAVAIVEKEDKSLAITMTWPDVETGKSMATKVLAMPELVPYGVTLDVHIAR
jgi:hypothetical protein